MSPDRPPPLRRRVDLRHLPRWQQYTLALLVTAAVVVIAWLVGGDESVPAWVSKLVVPALGWLVLAIVASGLAIRLLRRQRGGSAKR